MSQPLPPGQRDTATFPRFGLTQFARRFPKETSRPNQVSPAVATKYGIAFLPSRAQAVCANPRALTPDPAIERRPGAGFVVSWALLISK